MWRAVMQREDRFGWVLDGSAEGGTSRTKNDVGSKAKRSVWDRFSKKDDDDDDLPGPNAGATLWPAALVGRDAPA